MQRIAGFGFILLGVLHMALLGRDALPELGALLSGALWTTDHMLLPVAARDPALLRAEHAFWSTVGGAGVPLVVIGLAVLRIDRLGRKAPASVSVVLAVWSAAGTALMEPSGFPLILLVSLLLLAGRIPLRSHARQGA